MLLFLCTVARREELFLCTMFEEWSSSDRASTYQTLRVQAGCEPLWSPGVHLAEISKRASPACDDSDGDSIVALDLGGQTFTSPQRLGKFS
mmetsp:Transcript_97139/g.283861  ORF Transcript_97139/g.283861 Transcript_97139/m.283861 type:complete len:91 (-) Transcript_97139:186-458(-)